MPPTLYHHPFSSYSQKAETAFYEKGVEFEAKVLKFFELPKPRIIHAF